jgi:hypothetical protein
MKDLTVLEMLNQHPIAGALLLALLMSIAQIVRAWKGDKSVNRIESETNKLAKQTSETVNTCASRTHALIEVMEEFMAQNDVRRVHSRLDDSISLLEKVHDRESAAQATLVRVDNICRDILSSLERTDSRVVHGQIVAKIEHLQSVVDDIKRIEIDASKGG